MNEETTKTAAEAVKPAFWAVLPAAVRYDEELPPNAKLLYAEISSLTDRRGYCYASNEYFTRVFSLSERTIQNLLNALKRSGYIRILDGSGGSGRRKIFAGLNPLLDNPAENCGVTPQKNSPNPAKNCTQTSIENKKENNPPKAPQGAGADFVPKEAPDWKPERFSAFWNFYPLHKSKQATIRAWDRLKPSDELLAVIGKALMRQIAEKKQEAERSRKPFEWKIYASTYLNGARWTDEAEEPVPVDEPSYTGRKDLVQL